LQKSADKNVNFKLHSIFFRQAMLKKKENAMRSIALVLLSLFLSGCQINPYTFQPDWTSPDWFVPEKKTP
jgi:uncharacterized lipoprotein YajG